MAIRSGIGIGEAQVFDTSGLANQYAKQVAADQANLQRQAIANQKRNDEFLKDLAGTVASTKLLGNGLHPKDVSKLTDYRAKTLELYNKASQAKNPQEKALLKAEVDKSIEQQLEYVNGAKFFRQSGGELFNEILKNPWDYDDNVRNTVKDVLSNSYSDAIQKGYGVLDKTSFKSIPDGTELNKSLDNVHKYVDKAAFLNTPAIRTTAVGQNKDYTVIGSTAKESDVFDYNKSLIEANNKLRYDVKSDWKIRNPDAQADPTDNDLAIHLTNLYKEKYGPQAFKAQGSPQKIAKAGGAGSDVVVSTPIRLSIPFADGKGSVDVPDYVKLPLPKQNFAGSNYIDMATGKPATDALESSNDYEVVGVGNFPIITKGNMKGSLSQPKFARENRGAVQLKPMVHVQKVTAGGYKEDLLIPYDRLPASAKTKKALANFTPSVGKPTIPTGGKPASTAGKGTQQKSKGGISFTVE